MRQIPVTTTLSARIVKGEDLNHHQTLYAGRLTEWFIEAGVTGCSAVIPVNNVFCVRLHGLDFRRAAGPGDVVHFESKPVWSGTTSVMVYVQAQVDGKTLSEGFITFVHVDEHLKAIPHQIELVAVSEPDRRLWEEAAALAGRG